jgi:hypothetical protein
MMNAFRAGPFIEHEYIILQQQHRNIISSNSLSLQRTKRKLESLRGISLHCISFDSGNPSRALVRLVTAYTR